MPVISATGSCFKMTEPSKVIHVRNVGHEIAEVFHFLSFILIIKYCGSLFSEAMFDTILENDELYLY